MRQTLVVILVLPLIIGVMLQSASSAVLLHSYPFDEHANDVVGGANGALMGSAFFTNGSVALNGTNGGVQLPINLLTNYSSVSFEAWFVDNGSDSSAYLYDFAASTSGSANNMFYTVGGNGGYRVGSVPQVTGPMATVVRTNHLIWTQDSASQIASLYLNGLRVGLTSNFTHTPSLVGTTSVNRVGVRANSTGVFRGWIHEFRIYSGALSPLEVALLNAAGSQQPLPDSGALQAIRLESKSPIGPGALLQPKVFADFLNISNVNVASVPELLLVSDNTNALVVTSDQQLQSIALGAAGVTARYQGRSGLAYPFRFRKVPLSSGFASCR